MKLPKSYKNAVKIRQNEIENLIRLLDSYFIDRDLANGLQPVYDYLMTEYKRLSLYLK